MSKSYSYPHQKALQYQPDSFLAAKSDSPRCKKEAYQGLLRDWFG